MVVSWLLKVAFYILLLMVYIASTAGYVVDFFSSSSSVIFWDAIVGIAECFALAAMTVVAFGSVVVRAEGGSS